MPDPTRRAVLGGCAVALAAAAGAGLGLTRGVHHKLAVYPEPPPVGLTEALRNHNLLLIDFKACQAAGVKPAQLTPFRIEIVAHRDALLAVLENYPGWRLSRAAPPSPAPPRSTAPSSAAAVPSVQASSLRRPVETAAGLRTVLDAQARQLSAGAIGWPANEPYAGMVVPLFGSIAACLTVQTGLLA